MIADFEADLQEGRYAESSADWSEVFVQAEKLARTHGAATLCHSLDVLQVALAQAIGVTEFCTLDRRQAEMAKAAGILVVP